jgi:hypothetical protein
MVKVELDPTTRTKLDGVTEHVELCDEHGRTIGHFLPPEEFDRLFFNALAAETGHSAEELRQSFKETGGRPLKEIWQRLGQTS